MNSVNMTLMNTGRTSLRDSCQDILLGINKILSLMMNMGEDISKGIPNHMVVNSLCIKEKVINNPSDDSIVGPTLTPMSRGFLFKKVFVFF